MSEYRLRMEDGNVLVITLEVMEAEEHYGPDPQSVLSAFASALGLGGSKAAAPAARSGGRPAPRAKRPAPPPEPDADDWLAQSSAGALRNMTRER